MFSKSDTLPLNPFILGNQRKRVRFKPGNMIVCCLFTVFVYNVLQFVKNHFSCYYMYTKKFVKRGS